MTPVSRVSPGLGSGCSCGSQRGDNSRLAVGCSSSSVPQFPLSAMGVVSLGQGCRKSRWKAELITLAPFGARRQPPSSSFGSRRRALGAGGRDAAEAPSPAGGCQAGGRGAPGSLGGVGLATWFLHQGRGRSARRQRWGTLIVDAGGLGAGQAQADLGPAPEPLPKR